MTTMRITMTQTRMGESGSLLTVAGSPYTVSLDFGAKMVGAGYATDIDGALTPPDSQPLRRSADGTAVVSGDEIFPITRTYTWATLPAAADYIGTAHVTDIGARGSLWRSDGSAWGIVGGSVILGAYGADLTVTAASTSEIDLVTLDIPAGLMGLNGQLVVTHFWEATNNANVKTMRVKLGGTAFFANAVGINSNAIFLPPQTVIWNRNSQSSQMAFAAANGNTTVATGTAKTTGTVDTSAATTLVISGQKATGSDTLTLLGYRVELVRP